MKINIIDKVLMAERLGTKMIEKGYVHKNGKPYQLLLVEAIGEKKIHQKISSLLRKEHNTIEQEHLTKIAKALNCQEQWLLGGDYSPYQERPLFKEDFYQPEEKVPEKAENELLKALWGIVRQLQLTNKIEMIKQKAYFIWAKLEQEELIRLGGMSDEDIELHRRLLEIYKEAYQSTKKLEEKRNG